VGLWCGQGLGGLLLRNRKSESALLCAGKLLANAALKLAPAPACAPCPACRRAAGGRQ
jgi:hypothetical protein